MPSGPNPSRSILTAIHLRSSRNRQAAVAALAAVGLLLGACSGGGDSAAKTAARKATVERTDLPPDWTQGPAPDLVGSEGDDSRFAMCVGRPDPKTVRKADVQSDEFRSGDTLQVTSTVRAMPDDASARADLAALRGDRAGPCLRVRLTGAIDRQSAGGKAPASVTVDRLPGLDVGDEAVAFRAKLTTPAGDGDPKTTYVDVVQVRKGKLEIALTLTSAGQPFPADLQRDLLNRIGARI